MFHLICSQTQRVSRWLCLSLILPVAFAQANDSALQPGESGFTQRIIDGRSVPISTYPSTVALVNTGNFSVLDRQFCAGSVVARRWVMTAAHCVHTATNAVTSPGQLRIVEGVTELRDSEVNQEHVVVNVIPHPAYVSATPTNYNNDIALLEVATDLASPPVRLFASDADTLAGSFAFIVGWGAVQIDADGRQRFPIDLRAAAVPFVTRAVCNAPESYRGFIRSTMFCAGFREGGPDTCQADSGGPLYAAIDGALVQVGVTSFGNGCGVPNFYGVYTHVPTYLPWMSDFISVTNTVVAGSPTAPPEDDPTVESTDPSTSPFSGGSSGGASWAFLWLFGFALMRSTSRRIPCGSDQTRCGEYRAP